MQLKFADLKLPMLSAVGTIYSARCAGYIVNREGRALIVPQIGGITYNVRTGDSAFGYAANHVEPGVSITNGDKQDADALITLACLGNEALVVSGDARGARGIVTGKHLSMEYFARSVIVDFEPDVLDKLVIGDRILIKTQGQGLALHDFPEIRVHNIDPLLLKLLGIRVESGELHVPIAARIPAELMSYKVGIRTTMCDIDLQSDDPDALRRHGLLGLRLGDIVLIEDLDTTYSGSLHRGAISVGVVVTGDALRAGHGPGIVSILSAQKGNIQGVLDAQANIGNHFLELRAQRGEKL